MTISNDHLMRMLRHDACGGQETIHSHFHRWPDQFYSLSIQLTHTVTLLTSYPLLGSSRAFMLVIHFAANLIAC